MKQNKESKKRFTMRVTEDQLHELKLIATLHKMTMTEFVDKAIRKAIIEFKQSSRREL